MDVVGRYVAIIIAVILLFLFPLQYIAQSQSETIDDVVCSRTTEFADTARYQGYITLDDYEGLIYELDQTGELYDITIETSHPVSGKELSEVPFGEQMPSLKTENLKNQIMLFANHTHKADCYAGHNHAASGCTYHLHTATCNCTGTRTVNAGQNSTYCGVYNPNQWRCGSCGAYYSSNVGSCTSSVWQTCGGTYAASQYKCNTCGLTFSSPKSHNAPCGGTVNKVGTKYVCSKCGWVFSHSRTTCNIYVPCSGSTWTVAGWSCASCGGWSASSGTCKAFVPKPCGGSVSVSEYKCSSCGTTSASGGNHYNYTSYYKCNKCSSSTTGSYGSVCGALICGYSYNGWSCGITTDDTTPKCNQVVVSIAATNPVQSVIKGSSIITTATATYLDGTSATVSCDASGFNPNTLGTQTVTLSYSGLVGNARTSGTKACITTVTVTANKYPTSLSVTPSSTAIYNGKPEPTYTVVLTYSDASNITLTSAQYTKTEWTAGIGTKTVTFTYKEGTYTLSKSIIINVLPNLTGITVSPATQSIKRYSNPAFTVKANYEDSTSKIITGGYTATGLNINNLGTQTVTFSYKVNNITKTATAMVTVNRLTVTCPICGATYDMDANDMDLGCPVCAAKAVSILITPTSVKINKGSSLPISVSAVYQNGKFFNITGWSSDYDPNELGVQNVKVSFQGLYAYVEVETILPQRSCPTCSVPYSLNDDGTDPGCPTCSIEVVSINAIEDNVTILKDQPLPITVLATYKDGHSVAVMDWATNFVPSTIGTFVVSIIYKSASDYVTVKVISRSYTTCPICGLGYDTSGNPFGCPVCSKTIVSIEASLRNGGRQVMYKSQISLQIILVYKDNHRMITYTGYTISGYLPDKIGIQSVMVHYDTLSTALIVEVINGPAMVVCPNGHEYYLNGDGTDPGCPDCDIAAEKDNAIFYFDITYTNDIVSTLYKDGVFNLEEGDYLTITVTRRDVSLRARLRKMFFGTNRSTDRKKYLFGGEVL